jgi:hypothetical protein
MKKRILPIIAFLALPFISFNQIGAVAPDFTVTDLDGNSHNLYSILNSNRIAIVDASATWCGPCWGMHSQHYLRDLNEIYGPNGTDQVRIIFYEADANTTLADLQGTTGSTQGDWLTGTTYPVVNESPLTLPYDVYWPTGLPTMNVIHPFDKKIKHDLWSSWNTSDPVASLNAMKGLLDVIIDEIETATAGITEVTANQFTVFPNPVQNNMLISGDEKNISKIVLTNELGQAVKTLENEFVSTIVDVSSLEEGVYFVTVYSKDSTFGTKKFVKK